MLADEQLPSMQDIRFYLTNEGWNQRPPGPAGALWTRDDATIAVPEVDDPMLSSLVVVRLAQLSRKPREEIAAEVKYYATDVTEYRAANDRMDLESIPLSSALTIIDNVRRIIRVCGTTAFRPRGDLKAHYSPIGDSVWRSARMAHTKKGSFIIPVLLRLSIAAQPDARQKIIEVATPETFERRVTRTMAQALRAVEQAIVEPGTEPSMDRLHTAVEMGVSRELCVALHKLLKEPIVGELDTTFHWAPAVQASARAPRQVSIPAESRDLIDMAAKKLRNVRDQSARTMTGTIVGLRHIDRTPFGEITISTTRDGRSAEVTIRLPYEDYLPTLDWHRDRRVLIVEGEVEGGRGHRLYVEQPTRCEPIEDLFTQGSRRLRRPNWRPAEPPPAETDERPEDDR
jgi:hypothetical protein